MQVYMLKDVENVGMTGQIVKVTDGYASNYLLPNKLAKEVSASDAKFYAQRVVKQQATVQVLNTKAAMLAERLKTIHVTIKEKVHDDGKLYGSVSADKIVELLKEKEVSITKKQVEFGKSIKSVGEHKVTIKLSSKLLPEITVKVVALK